MIVDPAEPGIRARAGAYLRRLALKAALYGAALLALLAGLVVIGFYFFSATPPSQARLWEVNKIPSVTVLDRNGERLAVRGAFYGDVVELDELPPHVVQAFLAIEDRRFFEHSGVDLRALLRASLINLRYGELRQGGSTITQQLAKNLFLTNERTWKRKIKEVAYALWFERHLSKDEILKIYLNRIYLGAGTYGIDAAARFYFGKSARDLDLAEAAMLAGLPKAPTRFAPTSDLALAQERADLVLDSMVAAGYAGPSEVYAAQARPAEPIERPNLDGLQYFVDYVIGEAQQKIGDIPVNLVIRTTLDPKLQDLAETTVVKALEAQGEDLHAEQGALVTLSHDGEVLAMVGGRAYGKSQFNRATQAMRQPGSAFKPFVFLAALEAGMSPDSRVWDEPTQVGDWAPENYGGRYHGRVTMREAMEHSLNTVAVQISEQVGRDKVLETARRLGIKTPLAPNRSLPLGTSETDLLDLTGAYLEFARNGMSGEPYAILSIESEAGDVLWQREQVESKRVIEPELAEDMTNMLYQVVNSGTGTAARFGNWDIAGKTGTSQDWRDAWFVGYTAKMITGVWVGNDDDTPMNHVTGGGLPAEIWADFMAKSHEDVERVALPGAYPVKDDSDQEELHVFLLRLAERFDDATSRPRQRQAKRRSIWDIFDWGN